MGIHFTYHGARRIGDVSVVFSLVHAAQVDYVLEHSSRRHSRRHADIRWLDSRFWHPSLGSWLLFSLLFFWQLPHFYAIAWKYHTDYPLGNFKMLPSLDTTGKLIARQVIFFTCLTVLVSLSLVVFIPSLRYLYLLGALALGGWFIYVACKILEGSHLDFRGARKVIKTSVLYLPVLFLFVIIDSFL